jgi:hypothetical protein
VPVRSLSATSFFDPEFVAPGCLVAGTLPWVLARGRARWFPTWLFAHWRGHGRRGRDAWPAIVLLTLVLLRWSETGMSRRASVRRAATDAVWRAAMGLEFGTATPSERTLRDFERFLRQRHAQTQVPRYLLLHEHIVRACLDADVVATPPTWAMDSTPMWCYGATRDTIRLLGDGVRMLARAWGRATRRTLGEIATAWELPFLLAKSTKGAFPGRWDNPEATTAVVTQLGSAVLKAVHQVRRELLSVRPGLRKALLRRCRHLLRVISNDLATDAHGQLIIAERACADRLVSLTDPQARHGRKSSSQSFNGFKVHLLGDVVSGLITAVTVTGGNVHDSRPAHQLIRRAQGLYGALGEVLADTAYGGICERLRIRRLLEVELIAPPPAGRKGGVLGKHTVQIDFAAGTATCAHGIVTHDWRSVWSCEYGMAMPLLVWPTAICRTCPLQADCCGHSHQGRRLRLHPYEADLRAVREHWPQMSARYRMRSQCERLINQITRYGGRQAGGFGLRYAHQQAHVVAATVNLRLLAQALVARLAEAAASVSTRA